MARTYVYRCISCGHEEEATHSMHLETLGVCGVCGEEMKRKPQPLRAVFRNPLDILTSWADKNWRYVKAGSKERFSPDHVNSPEPLPQKDYHTRR